MQVNHEAIVALGLASLESLLLKLENGQEITPQEMESARAYLEAGQKVISSQGLMLAVIATMSARAKQDGTL